MTKIFLVALGLTANLLTAKTVRVSTLSELSDRLELAKLKAPVLMVFDLHGTLAFAEEYGGIGSDEWLKDLFARNIPFLDLLEAWMEIHNAVGLSLFDPDTPSILTRFQQSADTLVVSNGLVSLTSRYVAQTSELGLNFAAKRGRLRYDMRLPVPDRQGRREEQIRFEAGILAIGPNVSKGRALKVLFDETRYSPGTIVAVDSREASLEEIAGIGKGDVQTFLLTPTRHDYDPGKALAGLIRFADGWEGPTVCKQLAARLRAP